MRSAPTTQLASAAIPIAISVPVQTACARDDCLSVSEPCSMPPSSAPSPAAGNRVAKETLSKLRLRVSSQTAKPPHSSARAKSVRLTSGSSSVIAARFGRSNLPLGKLSSSRASFRLDIGGGEHLAPFFRFICNEAAQVGGRAGEQDAAHVGEPRFDLRIGETGIDLGVEALDDHGGRVLRRRNAEP